MAVSDRIEEALKLSAQASRLRKAGMTGAADRLKKKAEQKVNRSIARIGKRPPAGARSSRLPPR